MNTAEQLVPIGGFQKEALLQFQPSALEAAVKERDRLLAKNKTVAVVITNADEAALVTRALKANKNFCDAIEDARVEYKKPVLDLGRRIDAVADSLTKALEADASRFSKMLGSYQAEQNRLAEEARIKAHNEEVRLREEAAQKEAEAREAERVAEQARKDREAAEQKKRDDEAAARQKELDDKASRARTEAGRAKAEKEAQEAREQKERDDREREAAAQREEDQRKEQAEKDREQRESDLTRKVVDVRIEVATSAPVMQKPAGIVTRKTIQFRVDDINALYKANPLLVKLVPETALIKAALRNLPLGGTLPGVSHWEENASHVR